MIYYCRRHSVSCSRTALLGPGKLYKSTAGIRWTTSSQAEACNLLNQIFFGLLPLLGRETMILQTEKVNERLSACGPIFCFTTIIDAQTLTAIDADHLYTPFVFAAAPSALRFSFCNYASNYLFECLH